MMKRQLHCDTTLEVIGSTVVGLIDNLHTQNFLPYLRNHRLLYAWPDVWYPAQDWLAVMNDYMQGGGEDTAMIFAGMSVAERIHLAPRIKTLTDCLFQWDCVFASQHRNGSAGQINTQLISDTHIITQHQVIYPDALMYGIGYGFARRLHPAAQGISVYFDPVMPRRDDGGAETIIHFEW